jgi:hypothetical protein
MPLAIDHRNVNRPQKEENPRDHRSGDRRNP